MPIRYPEPRLSGYVGGDGGGGSSVADIIMSGGQRQAQLLLDAGRQKAAAFEGIGSDLAGGFQAAMAGRDNSKVQKAVSAASAPGADPRAILSGLPPELQGRAMKGISDWNDMIGKRQESDLKIKKAQSDLIDAQRAREQHDLNTLAVGAHRTLGMFDTPAGAIASLNMLHQGAKDAGLADDTYDTFMSGANDAWQAAKGDPKNEAVYLDALKQQAGPYLQGLMLKADGPTQEKFKPETETLHIQNADGSVTDEIVPKVPGTTRTGAPKPVDLQHVETSKGIQSFNPRGGTLGPVIGQPKPPAALIVNNNAPKLSDAALDQAAETFYGTGKMPPNMGRGNVGIARMTQIMNRTAELHPDFNATGAQATFEANKKSLDKLQAQTDAVAAFETTAGKNAEILEGVLKKLPDTGTSILNAPLRSLEGKLGSEDIAAFNTIRQSVQNEYSRIISNPTLSGTMSDSARKEGEAILHGDMTVGQLRTALKILKAETANRHTSYQGQLDQIMGRIRGKSAGGEAAKDPLGIR